ncbi:MAG: serine hydrolase [Vulcanimicrobiaceae bacterium]
MHRSAFILTTLSAALFPSLGQTQEVNGSLRAAIARIPGTVGVYARTMALEPPLFVYNQYESFPAASTIKMLIMLAAFHAEEQSPGSIHEEVLIHRADLVGGSPFLAGARGGERYTVSQLLTPMIQLSDNSASNALISHFGFERINVSARRAGMYDTHLKRHFLDYAAIVRHHENVTTPADMGTLLYALERGSRESLNTVASSASCRRMLAIMLGQTDRDKIPAGLPHGTPVANKTGEVDGVRNDVGVVDPFGDSPFVLAVYTKHLTNYYEALRGINRISNALFGQIAHTNR